MKQFPIFKELVSFVVVIILFTVSIGISFDGIIVNQRKEKRKLGETQWISRQVQVEYMRFLNVFDRYALGDPAVGKLDLERRLDLLWSHLPLVVRGEVGSLFGAIDGAHETIKALELVLAEHEPRILALAAGDSRGYVEIRGALDPFEARFRDMVFKTSFASDIEQARFTDALRQDYLLLAGSLIGVLVSGSLLIVILIRQVRRARLAEAQALVARQQSEQANRAKSDFLAHMSHELRTPLNAIIGFAEMGEREVLGPIGNPKYREYAHDIHTSGLHLLNLINGLLDLSKIEAGKYELHEEIIDLAEVTTCSIRLVQEQARSAGLIVKVELPAALPAVMADKRALIQILLNLLSNAIKFTPEGGKIVISARPHNAGRYALCVADSGIGMKEADLATALTPFAQVESSLTRSYEGTGLGLSLAKYLADLHDCGFLIESQPGSGTAVTVVFPGKRLRYAAIAAE